MELVRQRWPVFAAELHHALLLEGETALAATVDELRVFELCGCDDDFCQSFFSAERPNGRYGEGHWSLELEPPWSGMLILDVVNDAVIYVEVLFRAPLC